MAGDDDALATLTGDERTVQEARERLKRGLEWENLPRRWFVEDTKFANADARNRDQWPQTYLDQRDDEDRPCLTINIIRTHNRLVINEALKNKSSVKIRPTGGEASYEASQAMQSLIRRTEYVSMARAAYRTMIRNQVNGGFGYLTLSTDYVSDRSFDQDVFIKAVRDPLCVVIDCDAKLPSGLDANWGFEFEDVLRADFFKQHPAFKDQIGKSTLGVDDTWINDKYIRRAMYHRRKGQKDTLVIYTEPDTQKQVITYKSEHPNELIDAIIAQIQTGEIEGNFRKVTRQSVEWFLIAGDKVVDRGDWPGKYIPLIRCFGEEVLIDGKPDWKSMTRWQIDQQRMLNYNASGQVEYGALQSKSPDIGAADAFEGQEQWKDANKKNYAFLAFQHLDSDGNPLPPQAMPQRQPPPSPSSVYSEGAQSAERWTMIATGQFQAQMGENDQQSAASGVAINERQKQSDTATYDFTDHQGDAYIALGTQLIDLYQKVYDTERLLHVLGEDGTKRLLKINPNSKDALQELKKEGEEAAILEFNPAVGEYECIADVGPNYATQRQEAWNAITIILQQNAELAGIIGDLLFKFGDFPGADEIMERLKREIQATKPYLFSEDDEPGLAAMQEQLKKLGALNGELVQKLAEMHLKLKGREEKRNIDAFGKDTERLKVAVDALAKLLLTPQQKAQMEHELEGKLHEHVYEMIRQANEPDIANEVSA